MWHHIKGHPRHVGTTRKSPKLRDTLHACTHAKTGTLLSLEQPQVKCFRLGTLHSKNTTQKHYTRMLMISAHHAVLLTDTRQQKCKAACLRAIMNVGHVCYFVFSIPTGSYVKKKLLWKSEPKNKNKVCIVKTKIDTLIFAVLVFSSRHSVHREQRPFPVSFISLILVNSILLLQRF